MQITLEELASHDSPQELKDWFLARFVNQGPEYQDVLNALAEEDKPDLAFWLLDHINDRGRSQLHIHRGYRHKHIFAARKVIFYDFISVTGWIRAGRNIFAENGLCAGLGIVAGSDIRCRRTIRSNGELLSGGRIDVRQSIEVSGGIRSAYSVIAGEDIRSGGNIQAGIKARDYTDAALEVLNDGPVQRATIELLGGDFLDHFEDGFNSEALHVLRRDDCDALLVGVLDLLGG